MRSPLTGSSWRPSPGIPSDLASWQSATLLAMCFHPKHRTVSPRFLSTCTQTLQPLKSEDYTEKSSDKFKWPEEISIHLGPVSSKPAVRKRGRERSKGLTPDMTDALELRATQLILCVSVWVSVFVIIQWLLWTLKKHAHQWLNLSTVRLNDNKK